MNFNYWNKNYKNGFDINRKTIVVLKNDMMTYE